MSYDPEFVTRMLVGNLGYVLLVVSMMMTHILLLRLFAFASGAIGAAYMWLWLSDPIGTGWECAFAMAAVFQIGLALFRNRPAALTDDERALQVELMPELRPRQVRALLRAGSWHEGDDGAALVRQGERADRLILLRSGSAGVLLNGRHVSTCTAGSLIGEIGFAGAAPATATVVANGPVRYLALDCADLRRLMKSDLEISDLINRLCRTAMEKRLIAMNEARSLAQSGSRPAADQTVVRFRPQQPAARPWRRVQLDAGLPGTAAL